MKNVIASIAAAGLSAAVLGLAAPAVAAPTGADNAHQTISQLEAQGNRVIAKATTASTTTACCRPPVASTTSTSADTHPTTGPTPKEKNHDCQ